MPTALDFDGTAVRQSRTAGLPMPPPLPGRTYVPTFNGNHQYRLPHPETGKLTSYTRASTVASTLEDTWMLDAWEKRMMLIGIQRSISLAADLDQLISEHLDSGGQPATMPKDLRSPLNAIAEEAQFRAGAKDAAEFGTATHAWCEWVDHGGSIWQVPEMFRPWVLAHRRVLAANGLTADPCWTERIVLNTRHGIAGTLDRLFWTHRRTLFLGDIKTSRDMDHSWLYFAIQLAIYHGASHMLSLDGRSWEPMPALDPDTVLVMHLPREDPASARIVPINMRFGAEALHTAMTVRRMRSTAAKRASSVSYELDSFTNEQRRWYAARFALETSQTEADMAEVWERYKDIWTPELTDLGLRTLSRKDAQ
jgi:hypothetical protein